MRVLVVAQHVNFFRNLETVIRELCRRGHEVTFLHGVDFDDPRATRKMARKVMRGKLVLTRGLETIEAEVPGVTSGHRPTPLEASCRALRYGRQVMNRATYLRVGHPSPTRVVESIERDLPPRLAAQMLRTPWAQMIRRPAVMTAWRRVEDASPPSATVVDLLNDIRPDVVLVTPTIWPKDLVEADYIHAAQTMGIPTVGYVNSWDNLTSKGTIHVLPDQLMVWNDAIAREAIDLHLVPEAIVRITGAPHLDHFFSMRPAQDRRAVCAEMGCPDDRPYVVYLCSSRTLVASEVDVATRLTTALEARCPNDTPTVVVRPHPTNPGPWADFAHPGIVVHPRAGDQADSHESWQQYFDQLSHAACAFGLNSTAFLEAVVAGRPCVTIVADEFWPTQGRTGHFRHLLRGDFLEVAPDMPEAAERIARILGGADEKREGRTAFARWFLRPRGLDVPASQAVADVIEQGVRKAARADAPDRRPAGTALARCALAPLTEWATWLAADEARLRMADHRSFLHGKHGDALKARVMFVVPDAGAFDPLAGLLDVLSDQRHRVHVLVNRPPPDDHDLSAWQDQRWGLTVGAMADLGRSPWRPLARRVRRKLVTASIGSRAEAQPSSGVTSHVATALERWLPLELAIVGALDEFKPDVVVVAPGRDCESIEVDVVRAARWLGVPSLFLPLRWDDLESTAALRFDAPDAIAVWSDAHGRIPSIAAGRYQIEVTGAVLPSDVVTGADAVDRAEFCRKLRLDPSRPIILAEAPGGSTRASVTAFRRWRQMARDAADPALNGASVVVYVEHPDEVPIWRRLEETDKISVARAGTDARRAPFRLNEALVTADVVVATTSSMTVEALARAKPVVALTGGDSADGDLERLCRSHVASDGWPLIARDADGIVTGLSAALASHARATSVSRPVVRTAGGEHGTQSTYSLIKTLAGRQPDSRTPARPSAWQRLLILLCAAWARRVSSRA